MGMAYTNTIAVATLAEACREMAGVKKDTLSWLLSMWHGLACCVVHISETCDIQVGLVQGPEHKVEIRIDEDGACGASHVCIFGGLLSLAQYMQQICAACTCLWWSASGSSL